LQIDEIMNPPELGDDDAAMLDGTSTSTSTEAGETMPNGNGDVLKSGEDTIGIGDGGVS
jgi:hypothetical protein